jgi:DNA-binding transcriptional MerR regulator
MAYYDAALVPRVRAIKRLQRELFLPLKVIRQVLDRLDDGEVPPDLAIEATIARHLQELAPTGTMTRQQVIDTGIAKRELEHLKEIGALSPEGEGAKEIYGGDDVTLVRLFVQARRAGLTEEMLPTDILTEYISALSQLVRVELQLFRTGVVPSAGEDLANLTSAAATLSERLVVLLRRKMLLPTLRELAAEGAEMNPSHG